MSITRIYTGRVTDVAAQASADLAPNCLQLDNFEGALWQHHHLFQHAINVHIVGFAAIADETAPPDDVLRQFRERVRAEWSGGQRKRGPVIGFGPSVAPLLGLPPDSSPDAVFSKILEGNTASAAVRHLAGLLLLEKCQGDAGISQGGRTYLPRVCETGYSGGYDFTATAKAAADGKNELAAALHDPEITSESLAALAARMHLGWTVKLQPDGYFSGGEARDRLSQAARHFSTLLAQGADTRVAAWAATHAADTWLADLLPRIVNLPDSLSIPANRKAAKELTFATLLFQHFPSPTSAALLALYVKAPKSAKPTSTKMAKATATPKSSSVDFARFGDDPILLARGERGFVYRGFTALPTLFPSADTDPASPASMAWKEFDIAAFKEALKAVNQFRLKTEERNARRDKLKAKLDYQLAQSDHAPNENQDEAADRDPSALARLGDDPRFIALKTLLDDLGASTGGHGLRRRGLRGWRDLLQTFRRLHAEGVSGPDAYETEIKSWQTEHRHDAGDIQLFLRLAQPAHHSIWLPLQASETDEHNRADDMVWAACQLFEEKEELASLQEPVRLTPADAHNSPRQFMFSDVPGKDGLKSVAQEEWELTTLARARPGAPLGKHRLRVKVSAPRLRRDELQGMGEAVFGPTWTPPLLTGLLGLDEARKHAPKPVRDFAFGLMPEATSSAEPGAPSPGVRRILINFPVTLDTDALSNRIGRAAYWAKQCNKLIEKGRPDQLLHLLWPGMKNAPDPAIAWWSQPTGLSALAIDLGQRTAAAAAVLEMRADGFFTGQRKPLPYSVGKTGGTDWRVAVLNARHLRLPGEDRVLLPHERDKHQPLEEEKSGASGRLATRGEWRDALDLASKLGETKPAIRLREIPDKAPDKDVAPSAFSYPEQNDELVRLARSYCSSLRLLHSLTWRLDHSDEKIRATAQTELASLPGDLAKAGENLAVTIKRLSEEFEARRDGFRDLLLRLVRRILPLRDRTWDWRTTNDKTKIGQLYSRPLRATDHIPSEKTRLAGQRGLSLSRLEQIEDIRRQFLSYNRIRLFESGQKPAFGADAKDTPLGEPCPELLEKLDRIKEERINQTAHLIVAEALGVRLRAHDKSDTSAEERARRDIHGEYEPIPGRRPVDMIVLENLDRYLSSQDRAPSENRRLMKWAHRALVDKIRLLAEPFGISILTVPAAYSSRFCARTGVVGFRAEEIHAGQLQDHDWRQLAEREKAGKLRDGDAHLKILRDILKDIPSRTTKDGKTVPFTLLRPKKGAQMFVPLSAPDSDKSGLSQADINAAINIGLRALVSPFCLQARPRWRLDLTRSADGTLHAEPVGAAKEGGNKLERALWSEARLALSIKPDSAKAYTGKRTLLFHDAASVAAFDYGKIIRGDKVERVATGRAIFSAVKQGQWSRIHALNRKRLSKAGLLTPKIERLLPPPDDDVTMTS